MGKVTFEFDDIEESYEILLTVNRHKFAHALDELKNYKRQYYKGYLNNTILIRDGKEIVTEEERKSYDYDFKGVEQYVRTEDVENDLERILDIVIGLLD